MDRILTISKITLKESVRDKIFVGLLLFLALFFLFSVYISTLSLGTVARFIENTGMLGITLIALMVTILFGLFSLYREKERNELYVLVNRVPRYSYLLGRLVGSGFIIIIFTFVAGLGIFLLTWYFGGEFAPQLFWAVYWAILEFTLLTSIGLFFYTLGVGFTLNSLLVLAVFVVGHSMNEAVQSFVALGRYGSRLHLLLVKGIALLFPNFDMFDFRLAIVHVESIPIGQIALATLYWFFYLMAVLAVSSYIINRRDI
jgi:hypothetical protein